MREWTAATSATALAEFGAALGISAPSLVAVGAAWAAPHSAWAFPMCDGCGNVVGIRLRNERGKFAVRGSRQGIFVGKAEIGTCLQPLTARQEAESGKANSTPHPGPMASQARLQSGAPSFCTASRNEVPDRGGEGGAGGKSESEKAESGKVLFVCEGPTDTAAAVELGLFAVGRPNCCCGGPEIRVFARARACSRVVVVADNDKPGLDGARKVGGELELPFAVYVPPAKDLREFLRLGGTRAMIENTLHSTVWSKPES